MNNAAIFEPLTLASTQLPAWERHMTINLTAPFLLCQAFARQVPSGEAGRINTITGSCTCTEHQRERAGIGSNPTAQRWGVNRRYSLISSRKSMGPTR